MRTLHNRNVRVDLVRGTMPENIRRSLLKTMTRKMVTRRTLISGTLTFTIRRRITMRTRLRTMILIMLVLLYKTTNLTINSTMLTKTMTGNLTRRDTYIIYRCGTITNTRTITTYDYIRLTNIRRLLLRITITGRTTKYGSSDTYVSNSKNTILFFDNGTTSLIILRSRTLNYNIMSRLRTIIIRDLLPRLRTLVRDINSRIRTTLLVLRKNLRTRIYFLRLMTSTRRLFRDILKNLRTTLSRTKIQNPINMIRNVIRRFIRDRNNTTLAYIRRTNIRYGKTKSLSTIRTYGTTNLFRNRRLRTLLNYRSTYRGTYYTTTGSNRVRVMFLDYTYNLFRDLNRPYLAITTYLHGAIYGNFLSDTTKVNDANGTIRTTYLVIRGNKSRLILRLARRHKDLILTRSLRVNRHDLERNTLRLGIKSVTMDLNNMNTKLRNGTDLKDYTYDDEKDNKKDDDTKDGETYETTTTNRRANDDDTSNANDDLFRRITAKGTIYRSGILLCIFFLLHICSIFQSNATKPRLHLAFRRRRFATWAKFGIGRHCHFRALFIVWRRRDPYRFIRAPRKLFISVILCHIFNSSCQRSRHLRILSTTVRVRGAKRSRRFFPRVMTINDRPIRGRNGNFLTRTLLPHRTTIVRSTFTRVRPISVNTIVYSGPPLLQDQSNASVTKIRLQFFRTRLHHLSRPHVTKGKRRLRGTKGNLPYLPHRTRIPPVKDVSVCFVQRVLGQGI